MSTRYVGVTSCSSANRHFILGGTFYLILQCPKSSTLRMEAVSSSETFVESSWNVMAHGDAREGKWRGYWRIEWVASILHTTSEHGVSNISTADAHTSAAGSRLNWQPPPDLNGLVRLAERRNLVSARVPSHFESSLPYYETKRRYLPQNIESHH